MLSRSLYEANIHVGLDAVLHHVVLSIKRQRKGAKSPYGSLQAVCRGFVWSKSEYLTLHDSMAQGGSGEAFQIWFTCLVGKRAYRQREPMPRSISWCPYERIPTTCNRSHTHTNR